MNCSLRKSEQQSDDGLQEFPDLPSTENLIKNISRGAYFFVNYDLFAIYKGTFKNLSRRKYRFYLRPELRLSATTKAIDKWRYRFRIFSLHFYALLSMRFMVICFVQLAKYQATTFDSRTDSAPLMLDTNLIKFLKQTKLYLAFDNFLSDFPCVALTIYVAILASIINLLVVKPHHYSIEPIDAVNLRIGLNPRHERKRICLLMKEKLKSLLMTTSKEKNQSLSAPFHHLPLSVLDRRSKLLLRMQQQAYMANLVWQREKACFLSKQPRANHPTNPAEGRAHFGLDTAMLPARYQIDYPAHTWRLVFHVTLLVVAAAFPFCIMIQIYLIRWSTEMKCKIRNLSQATCSTLNALTPFELYSLVELYLAFYIFGIAFAISNISILIHAHAQFIIINEMKSDMNDLLGALRLINCRHDCLMNTGVDSTKIAQREVYLDDALVKILTKVSVSLEEFRSQASFISQQVSSGMFFFNVTLVLALTTGKLEGPDMKDLRRNVFILIWASANIMLALCARQFADIIKLQKIGWSILAQLYLLIETRPVSLMNAWLRLIEGDCLSGVANSIRPFGVSLTFNQILQLNFYVSSLAVLVLR